MNFYKHHLGDYDGATVHLSWDEDAAYTRLLRAYYRREKPIPDAEKYRLSRAASRAQRAAVDSVLSEFFDLREDGWHNKRADEEIAAYQTQADTNRRIARSRTGKQIVDEPLDESLDEPSTKHTPSHKPEPEPLTRSQSTPKASADAQDWLPPEFWEFEQHRREKKSPLTATARRNCIAKLARWRAEGKDVAGIIRYSMEQGWAGIFEPDQRNGSRAYGVTAGNVAAAQEFVRRGKPDEDENETPTP